MCLNMPELEAKVEKREAIADKLEKTRSLELATGKQIQHRCEKIGKGGLGARERRGWGGGDDRERGHKRRRNIQPCHIVGDIFSAVQLSDKIWSWG